MPVKIADKCGYCQISNWKIDQPLYSEDGSLLFCGSTCLERYRRRLQFLVEEFEEFMYEVQVQAEESEDMQERMDALLKLQDAYTLAAQTEQILYEASAIIPF